MSRSVLKPALDSFRIWTGTAVFVACGLALPASAGLFPRAKVERALVAHDQQLASEVETRADDDGRYYLEPSDVIAAAHEVLARDHEIAVIFPQRLETDWRFGSSAGTNASGEWFRQTRQRLIVEVATTGEVTPTVTAVAEQRLHEVDKPEPTWAADDQAARRLESRLRPALAARWRATESERLTWLWTTMSGDELRQLMAVVAPTGFELLPDPTPITLERVATVREASRRRSARWERRQRIELHIVGGETRRKATFKVSEHDRLWDDDVAGAWTAAAVSDPRALEQVRRALIEAARDSIELSEPVLAGLSPKKEPLTDAPEPPPLRTAAELQAADVEARRAEGLASGTGWFRLEIEGVVVEPTKPDGSSWDPDLSELAGASAAAVTTVATSSTSGGAAVGEAVEDLTAGLPLAPDVSLHVAIAGTSWTLGPIQNNGRPTYSWHATHPFFNGSPTIELEIRDLDTIEHDHIGACQVRVREILAAGGTLNAACGSATVAMKAEWLRDLL